MGLMDFFKKKSPESSLGQFPPSFEDLELLPNGDIRLYPSASCPLTLYNTTLDTARQIQGFFDYKSAADPKDNLRLLFMAQPVGIREVDALVRGEDCCLSEIEADKAPLYEHHAKDRTPLYDLSKKYKPDLMDIYFQEMRYSDYVRNLNRDHSLRPVYERLVQCSLAIRGTEIPLQLVVASLGRDHLHAICKQHNLKGKRKNVDTAALLCEKPEVKAFIESSVNLDQCFMVKQSLEVAAAASLYEYTMALSELVFCVMAGYISRASTIKRAEEAFSIGAIEGLQYNAKYCQFGECKSRHGKIYTPTKARALKFKPGCRCDLLPYNSRWENR